MKYRTNNNFSLDCGFKISIENICEAVDLSNNILSELPSSLYRCIDFKTISSVVGAIYCETLASKLDAIVNPIEKGHPDIVPQRAEGATEAQLRNYPQGLEVKSTIGNIETGANLRAGEKRVGRLTGLTWQAHHREVTDLMGLTWDFALPKSGFNSPAITGVFYGRDLTEDDWGSISGISGRNTKVSGMRSSGKEKMGVGWIVMLDEADYLSAFQRFLKIPNVAE
ncbi:hypothetical protein [Bosea sp. (in: a-proteobacteria)]|jgi:hypothetical protein|uniref:hypothetical protein n=1 Tax=Bosea sp. (in: a-proteobacteria) TaxID=1871050 RepID=UPI0035640FC1